MDKKTLLAIVLSFAVLMGWNYLITPIFVPEQPVVDNQMLLSGSQSVDNITSSSNTEVRELSTDDTGVSSQLNLLTTESSKLLSLTFNEQTGDIRSASILKWNSDDGSGKITFNKNGGYNDYAKISLPKITTPYKKTVENTGNGKKVIFTAESGPLIISKIYELSDESYLVKTTIDITNKSDSSLKVPVSVRIGPKLGDGFDKTSYGIFEGAIISNGDKTYRVSINDTDEESLNTAKWAGYTSKYFLFAAVSDNTFKNAKITAENGSPVSSVYTETIVNPDSKNSLTFDYYIGPKFYQDLKALGFSLQKSMDYGWFYFIAIPMLYILNFLYDLFHNYGIAIIILTIIVRLAMLPLTIKSTVSMRKVAQLNPEIMKLREMYKNNPQKLQQETMELYKREGANPLSGCLPLLLQIPIFFALYKALLLSLELKGAPFFGWLTDLSAHDPYYITPILMGLTMFIQQKMSPGVTDPVQQKIFLAMPILFTFLFLSFPSGLVLYWLTNNILGIIQQYFVNNKYPIVEAAPADKDAKKETGRSKKHKHGVAGKDKNNTNKK